MTVPNTYSQEQMATEENPQATHCALYTILVMVFVIGILTAAAIWYLFFQ